MGIIRPLPDEAIEQLLQEAVIARLACCTHDADSRPYLVPIPCFYDGGALYALSGPGKKVQIMRANPLVTIEVDSGIASDHWQSVVAEGVYEELTGEIDREDALGVITTLSGEKPVLDEHSVLFRIRLVSRSGRFERPATDPFPEGNLSKRAPVSTPPAPRITPNNPV